MENILRHNTEGEQFELPPGFRFHPTDEELITHYLSQKILDSCFCARVIGEVHLNRCEPWDLPRRAKMGEKEWYFFCLRDRKYPSGSRTNRATDAGYWKATGKDREIHKAKVLIGMKKTLVFYKGRAPKGEKTNWVIHEYRLEEELSEHDLPETATNDWVLCRVFQKRYRGKKLHIAGLARSCPPVKDPPPSLLMDYSPYNMETRTSVSELSPVTCFSGPNQTEEQQTRDDIVDKLETPILASSSSSKPSDISRASWSFPNATPQIGHQIGNSQYADYFPNREQSTWRMLIENHGPNQDAEFSQQGDFGADISSVIYNNNEIVGTSFENQECSSASAGPGDSGWLWN